ncbi:MAG: YCF48-related protein [Hymenobacter sp.]
MWFVDVNQGYVIGDGGTARRTTDGGSSWQPMAVNTTVNLNAVRFLNATTGFIVGDLGTLLLTTDGGQTWRPEASHTYETLNAISATADGEHTWIVGGNGTVLKRGMVVPSATRPTVARTAWQAYPNPFVNVLTISLPTQLWPGHHQATGPYGPGSGHAGGSRRGYPHRVLAEATRNIGGRDLSGAGANQRGDNGNPASGTSTLVLGLLMRNSSC